MDSSCSGQGPGAGISQSVKRRGYGLEDRSSTSSRSKKDNLYLWHSVLTGSGAHPVSCPMGTGGLSLVV